MEGDPHLLSLVMDDPRSHRHRRNTSLLQAFKGVSLEDLGQGSALGPSTDQEHVQRSANSEMDSAPALVIVRHGFVTCAPRSLLTLCSTQPMLVSSICKHPEFQTGMNAPGNPKVLHPSTPIRLCPYH